MATFTEKQLEAVSAKAVRLADSLVVVAEQIRDCEGLDSGLIMRARDLINELEQTNREHNAFVI